MKFVIVIFFCLPACAQTWFSNVAKTSTTNSCTISWATAVPTIASIQYGLAVGSYTKGTSNTTSFVRTQTTTISSLNPGTTYHFKIVAADTSYNWVHSLDFTCVTKAATAASHTVKLNWQASNSKGVTGYDVYRSTVSGGYYGLLGTVAGLAYNDQTVQSGVTYYYSVKAVNSAGLLSSFSNQVMAVIP